MDKTLNELYELCEVVNRAIKEANEKIRTAGGKLTAGDVEYVDKLTHTLKSIKTTMAMIEADEDYSERGYSRAGGSYARGGRGGGGYSRGGSYGGGSYEGGSYEGGNSYARGRRGNVRRDSMGRYSRDDAMEGMVSELRELMEDAPDMQTKQEFQKFITKLEQM